MRNTFFRLLTIDERNRLNLMFENTIEAEVYRAMIILLKDAGFIVPEIRRGRLTIII